MEAITTARRGPHLHHQARPPSASYPDVFSDSSAEGAGADAAPSYSSCGAALEEDGRFKTGQRRTPSPARRVGCWRRCCCCCRRKRPPDRSSYHIVASAGGGGGRNDSNMGVLVIIVGLVLFSVAYFFSKPSEYVIKQISSSPWTYECLESACVRRLWKEGPGRPRTKRSTCLVTCGGALPTLWPRPTGAASSDGNGTFGFLPGDVAVAVGSVAAGGGDAAAVRRMAAGLESVLAGRLRSAHPGFTAGWTTTEEGLFAARRSRSRLAVQIRVNGGGEESGAYHASRQFLLGADEGYELIVTRKPELNPNLLVADITAASYVGARRAVETLAQLAAYDEETGALEMPDRAFVRDRPALGYRAVEVDTSERFIPVEDLKSLIDAMARNKLNVLHWRLGGPRSLSLSVLGRSSSSSASFSTLGPLPPARSYTREDLEELAGAALSAGVALVPDAGLLGPVGLGEGPWRALEEAAGARTLVAECHQGGCGMGLLNASNSRLLQEVHDLLEGLGEALGGGLNYLHLGFPPQVLHCGPGFPEMQRALASHVLAAGRPLTAVVAAAPDPSLLRHLASLLPGGDRLLLEVSPPLSGAVSQALGEAGGKVVVPLGRRRGGWEEERGGGGAAEDKCDEGGGGPSKISLRLRSLLRRLDSEMTFEEEGFPVAGGRVAAREGAKLDALALAAAGRLWAGKADDAGPLARQVADMQRLGLAILDDPALEE